MSTRRFVVFAAIVPLLVFVGAMAVIFVADQGTSGEIGIPAALFYGALSGVLFGLIAVGGSLLGALVSRLVTRGWTRNGSWFAGLGAAGVTAIFALMDTSSVFLRITVVLIAFATFTTSLALGWRGVTVVPQGPSTVDPRRSPRDT